MFVINPGSGPVADATLECARDNLVAFINDLELEGVRVDGGDAVREGDGRWEFTLRLGERHTLVDMPGLQLGKVRYVDSDTQNIWDFPRLYVDGSSWVWLYAVGCARDALTEENDERPIVRRGGA